jgi:hypothetical protein
MGEEPGLPAVVFGRIVATNVFWEAGDMIVRELSDGTVWAITQENHADLAAQFAAHWGNDTFAKLQPFETMVFATTYHDSGHREIDAEVPFDVENGRPYGHRNVPQERRRSQADNFAWLGERDKYGALLVSMHHSGLRKNRYDTVAATRNGAPGDRTTFAGIDRAFGDLEPWQIEIASALGLDDPAKRRAFWTNYCILQVFDLLSLYFCLDGYEGKQLAETRLVGIPTGYAGDAVADIRIVPVGENGVRMDPYPFDAPFRPVAPARILEPAPVASEAEGREAFYRAPREALEWEITA